MPSIIPEFEFDIFISYRHNDNKYDGWVSEFVEKLKQELDATVKDKLTVYFDNDPESGIRETDHVDGTIDNKLRALIFIPIISQTYCDVNAFAWKNEFQVFKQKATSDKYGINIRLPNGNVTSRILPIKIHDIETEDVRLLEGELDGVLRSVEFIYRDAGVNRPLRSVDDELVDGRTILYRNQINKVANAIKDIVKGIRMSENPLEASITSSISVTEPHRQVKDAISTSMPETVSVTVINQDRPSIFLAWTSQDLKDQREEMSLILQKAGFSVYPSTDCPADDEEFKSRVTAELEKCDCSLHLISNIFGRRFEVEEDTSFPMYQFNLAKQLSESSESEFHSFIWYTGDQNLPLKDDQSNFIKYIRNNITRNMTFSNSAGPMQLVDDIRVIKMREIKEQIEANETDIFFIFNSQDEMNANAITDMISSEYPVEIMNIQPDGEHEYREISAQQIPKSKLAVIYFKYAADWALPFIKQVWKQVGGASSPTPLMLIGEDDPASNKYHNFKAPKVVSTIVSNNQVSDEIKKVYIQVLKLN